MISADIVDVYSLAANIGILSVLIHSKNPLADGIP
jgi:hypothetical protein